MTNNHDFLAQIPLSPKEDGSDCNLSDLSSSNWSAQISVKCDYESAHERFKQWIPELDLSNLPPDSDDEEAGPKGTTNAESKDFGFVDQELAATQSCMNMANMNGFHQANNRMSVLPQEIIQNNSTSSILDLSKFNQSNQSGYRDLEELAQFDMHMGAPIVMRESIIDNRQRDSRLFLESFDRDPGILDENDMLSEG